MHIAKLSGLGWDIGYISTMKYCWLTVLLIPIVLSSCGNKYLDPEKIELSQYTLAAKEFIKNRGLISAPDMPNGYYFEERSIEKSDVNSGKIMGAFPLTYKLFTENKAEKLTYSAEGCVIIILKIHGNNFGATEECLRTGGPNNCGIYSMAGNSSSIEKDVPLKNGWRYQRASFFAF